MKYILEYLDDQFKNFKDASGGYGHYITQNQLFPKVSLPNFGKVHKLTI